MCEEFLITGCAGSRALPLFVLERCLFVLGPNELVSSGNGWLHVPPLIMLGLAMCRSSEHPPPSDLEEISACVGRVVWEVRLDVVKGSLRAENVAAVIRTHLDCVSSSIILSLSLPLPGSIVLPARVICPRISAGFLTPVDKRHPHLSAAATQPGAGLILRRAKNTP